MGWGSVMEACVLVRFTWENELVEGSVGVERGAWVLILGFSLLGFGLG